MRIRFQVKLSFPQPIELPIHYNHILQALIYDSIPDEKFRTWLHEYGFSLGKRNFKLFTFSRLNGRFELDRKNGKIRFLDDGSFIVSSGVDEVIQELGNGLLSRQLQLLGHPVKVREIYVLSEPDVGNVVEVRMLSPIVVYRTEFRDNKKFTHYFNPGDPEFTDLLEDNLHRKYMILFGEPTLDTSFKITSCKDNPKNLKVMKYKGTVIKGWMGRYKMEGNPDFLQIAYDCGLGTKNAQGFGCFEIIT